MAHSHASIATAVVKSARIGAVIAKALYAVYFPRRLYTVLIDSALPIPDTRTFGIPVLVIPACT